MVVSVLTNLKKQHSKYDEKIRKMLTYAKLYGNTEHNHRPRALDTFSENPVQSSYLFLITLMQDQIFFFLTQALQGEIRPCLI